MKLYRAPGKRAPEGQDRHCAGFLRREYCLAKDAEALLRPLAFADKM